MRGPELVMSDSCELKVFASFRRGDESSFDSSHEAV